MKRILLTAIILLFTLTVLAPASAGPGGDGPANIEVNVPRGGTLTLAVGESYTFVVEITSSTPFTRAQAGFDQYYPGRSVFADGLKGAPGGTSATLSLTVTGKQSTADLPGGVAPVSVVVAVRYGGNQVQTQYFSFNIEVK